MSSEAKQSGAKERTPSSPVAKRRRSRANISVDILDDAIALIDEALEDNSREFGRVGLMASTELSMPEDKATF